MLYFASLYVLFLLRMGVVNELATVVSIARALPDPLTTFLQCLPPRVTSQPRVIIHGNLLFSWYILSRDQNNAGDIDLEIKFLN